MKICSKSILPDCWCGQSLVSIYLNELPCNLHIFSSHSEHRWRGSFSHCIHYTFPCTGLGGGKDSNERWELVLRMIQAADFTVMYHFVSCNSYKLAEAYDHKWKSIFIFPTRWNLLEYSTKTSHQVIFPQPSRQPLPPNQLCSIWLCVVTATA